MSPRPPTRRDTPASLADQAVDRLRDMIVFLDLAPGAVLSERRLVEALGASRTPIREALKQLSAEGLVLLRPNRPAMVAPLDPDELRHLFEVEVALESFAASLAATRMAEADFDRLARYQIEMEERYAAGDRVSYIRINRKIHLLIVAGSGNPALSEVHARLIGRLQRARNIGLSSLGRVEESIEEHRQILAALRRRDGEMTRMLMARHVARTGGLFADYCAAARIESSEVRAAGRRRLGSVARHLPERGNV